MNVEQRIAQLSPAKLALLERRLKKSKPDGGPRLETVGKPSQKDAPLSFAQERLWFLDQMEPDSGLYNLPAIVPLPGSANAQAVVESVREIVARHGALRTRFVVKDDSPRQVIGDDADKAFDFAVIDSRSGEAASDLQRLSQTLNEVIWTPFDLATGHLLRVRLFLQPDNQNFLLVVMHHIVSDGWSINIFTNEFRALYEAASTGRVCSLSAPAMQYVDYAIAQRQTLEGDKLASLLGYWRAQLADAPSLLAVPFDRPRPPRQSFRGAIHGFGVPELCLQRLRAVCHENSVVPFMVLLSAFNVLLFRYAHQSKIVVGVPIANRNRSEFETVIGFFANTLVMCSSLAPNMTFRELLMQVRDTTLGAYAHQELPFEKLVSELQPERSLSHNPLFQVMFIFQNLPGEEAPQQAQRPDASSTNTFGPEVKFSKFDLTLAMTETDGGLSAVFEYATDLFEPATIERMAGHFVNILDYLLQHPDEHLNGFSFLAPAERELVLERWNDTGRKWPKFLPLHGSFEQRVRSAPDATALIYRASQLSYAELDLRATVVATLLQGRGVGRGSIVGICLQRSTEMVVGLFAILKAGAAYMPIDPDFPEQRVAYMLDNARAGLVLTLSACVPMLARHQVEVIALDELGYDRPADAGSILGVAVTPTDPAYVIFTSGSTGQPKGVVVSHGAIHNRLQWMQERYRLTEQDRVMQKTPFTFDVSVWEFFWPLSEGAGLVIAEPDRHKESAYLVELIKQQQVTCMHFVPSMLELFLHEDLSGCPSLKRIICSGEALTVEQCKKLQALAGVSAHNLYGPTEAAVDVTHWDCDQWRDQYFSIPIGRPIANTQIYILNERLQPAPIGVAGELYIGGANLADGYLNRPDLTDEKFIRNPFSGADGSRLYKTGDLARFRSDGNIEYICRIDSQIKLRGVRIELGEIEHALCQYPGVAEAVVVVNQFGDQDERLVAYVVPAKSEGSLDVHAIIVFLGLRLPNYMVPAVIMAIPVLPLTPNGKLDRKNLPKPQLAKVAEPAQSATVLESELLDIWRKFLKVETLDRSEDFFALGGHSILVTRVINSINSRYHLNVPVRLLFENSTVKSFAKALNEFEDKSWLDESRAAMAIMAHSQLHLLHTLDEATDEHLDEFLKQHADDPAIASFADVSALISWSNDSLSTNNASGAPGAVVTSGVSGQTVESPHMVYVQCYFELSQIKAAIDHILYQHHPLSPMPMSNGGGDLVASLQERGSVLFENYAHQVKSRWSEAENGFMAPAILADHCGQLLSLAGLAMSIMARPEPQQ
jgi:amino acid adenylation domain-containing protein